MSFRPSPRARTCWRDDPKWEKLARTLQRSVDAGSASRTAFLKPTARPPNLIPVIENAIAILPGFLGIRQPRRRSEFVRDIDPGFRLKGDPDQWERVLVNLFLNSAQAGATSIRIEAHGSQIVVSDDGPGIAPELLPRIFQPRVSTKSIISGLGLYVVRSLVEQNGGTVTASNGPAGGAVFTIRI